AACNRCAVAASPAWMRNAVWSLGSSNQDIHTRSTLKPWKAAFWLAKPEMWSACRWVMITSASCPPVSAASCWTAAGMAPMSLACTPQSISTCAWPPSLAGIDIRKKSPKPTRYMRMRTPAAPSAALAGLAMSASLVQQGEVDGEAPGLAGRHALGAERGLLAADARRRQVLGDRVAHVRRRPVAVQRRRLGDDQRHAAAQRHRPRELPFRRIVGGLDELDHHVDLELAGLVDPEHGMERGDLDL